jgi:ADP-ribose pyrophosphatase YjhB (NUDIX family)
MFSQYIKDLRKRIGNDFLLLPSVTILLFDQHDKILLVRHHNDNVWVAPGGMIEPDETPENAAIREMLEETGYYVKLRKTLGTYGGPEFRITYKNGDEVGYVMTVYMARLVSGEPKPDGKEILELNFFSYNETKNLSCGKWLPVILKDIFEKGSHSFTNL